MFGRFRKPQHETEAHGPSAENVVAAVESLSGALLEVVGPEDGGCVCNDWVGAVISVRGDDPVYPSLADAVADGLFHVGCRHTLRRYAPHSAAGTDPAQAQFRTQLALDLMRKRREAGEPGGEERFTRLYGWARRVDGAGGAAVAVVVCEAALQLLRSEEIFGDSQPDLERILKARIATIRRRMDEE